MNICSDPYKQYHFLKRCNENFQMQCIDCLNRLSFLVEVKFFIYFFHSKIIVTFILVFENSQNSFSCGPSFGPFWSVEYLNLEQNLPIWTVHHTFLESKHPEITKNPYYVLFLEGSQKKYQFMDYM